MTESLVLTIVENLNLALVAVIVVLLGYIWKSKNGVGTCGKTGNESGLPSKESVLHLIKERRSVMPKDLSGEKLSDEDIEYLLEAANWAPTHKKTEPWRYVVISGTKNILDYLDYIEDWYNSHRENLSEEELSNFYLKVSSLKSQLPNLSHMFVICMKRQALPDKRLPEWEELCATACSVQNIHLALTALPGCGGFWSSHTWCKHARDSEEFKDYLGLEAEDRVLGAFMLGRVAGGKTFRSTRTSWKNKVTMRAS